MKTFVRQSRRIITGACLFCLIALLTSCNSSVGVGVSVGVPVGNHGYISIGSGRRWH